MNNYLKSMLVAAAIAGLCVPATAFAGKSIGGVTGGARLHPGTWGNQQSSRSYVRSRPTYRRTAPVIVRTAPTPSAVAQAPTEERRFSYDPALSAEAGTPCPGAATTHAPATTQPSARTDRRFSYEPAESGAIQPSYRSYRNGLQEQHGDPLYYKAHPGTPGTRFGER